MLWDNGEQTVESLTSFALQCDEYWEAVVRYTADHGLIGTLGWNRFTRNSHRPMDRGDFDDEEDGTMANPISVLDDDQEEVEFGHVGEDEADNDVYEEAEDDEEEYQDEEQDEEEDDIESLAHG